ncbi:hypothetical protein B0I35DRAFT_359934 [Stachybotrys elegans]|uniref:Rhodopsin domain-containing protein n=1 Tax=Stachybotrys elegans TaxID=80388 RepID=A0A8K0WML3_9HYPO|nr:hypothetical protein B0I35DRAFT_359934 [Stachybotrys elegans]
MEPPPPPDAEQGRQLVIETWTLLGIVTVVTVLRTVSRIRSVGLKSLQADDYLVWLSLICFGIEGGLAYMLGTDAHGLANHGMSDEYRAALDVDGEEYRQRVRGSVYHICGWSIYSVGLWGLKAAWLFFYMRLTEGLGHSYRLRIRIGITYVAATWIAGFMSLFLSCRPFHRYWQISPDPGNLCQPAISNSMVWVWYAFNVSTDLYLLSIPLPMLWGARIERWKKGGLIFLFSGGIFVVICATLRSVLIFTDPIDGSLTAGAWGVRETFVAIITTNLPLVFALLKAWLGPVVGTHLGTGRSSSNRRTQSAHMGNLTVGSGAQGRKSWHARNQPRGSIMPTAGFSESEEQIIRGFNLQDMKQPTTGGSMDSCEAEPRVRGSAEVDVEQGDKISGPAVRREGPGGNTQSSDIGH